MGHGTWDKGQVNNVPYLPNTDDDRAEMLRFIGAQSIDELFADIPVELREKALLNLPPALSEPELMRHMRSLALQNIPLGELPDEPIPRPSSSSRSSALAFTTITSLLPSNKSSAETTFTPLTRPTKRRRHKELCKRLLSISHSSAI